MLFETKFLISLILTIIVELPILFIFTKYIFKLKLNNFKVIFVGFLASALTLPYLWFVLPPYIKINYYILLGEIFIFLIESFIYYYFLNLNFRKSALVSFIANLTSFVIGLIYFKLELILL